MSGASVTVLLGDPRLPDVTKVEHRYSPEDLEAVDRLEKVLATLEGWVFAYLDDHETLLAELAAAPPEAVLNFCDTGYRNDARLELHIPAYLEMLGIPHSGAGPTCLGLCYDKAAVRALAAARGVPVPAEVVVPFDARSVPPAPSLPALVKPRTGDGSVGIDAGAVVGTEEEAQERVESLRARLPGRDVLVQEFLDGPEYAVGLLGNPGDGFTALPILEVDYGGLPPHLPRILSYESKTVPDSPYWTELRYREAEIDEELERRLVGWARTLFDALGCRDYARFDFRAGTDGEVRLLEANPNPAWCWDGKMSLMAGFAGWSYAEFLRTILEAFRARIA